MNKINEVINSLKVKLLPKLVLVDSKVQILIPNSKLRKFLYIGMGSLFGFMFILIILGILLSPFRQSGESSGFILNKPKIENTAQTVQVELNETQKQMIYLETQIKELRFPESTLNIPVIESGIKI